VTGIAALLILTLLLFCIAPASLGYYSASAQFNSPALPGADSRLHVRRRRIVLVRSRKIAREFPQKKTAIVTYPVIGGLSDAAVLRKVRAILRIKNIFDSSLEDYRQDAWLTEFTYRVNFNGNHIFDITFIESGVGAYPETHSRHFIIDLKRGEIIKASEVFDVDKMNSLAALIDQKLQSELRHIEESIKAASLDAEGAGSLRETLADMKFLIKNLGDFSVGKSGVTFLYDAGLPHAIKAFEPRGRYFVAYSEIKPYIRSDGLLGQFIR
jgi:hypothetical protein